MGNRLSKIYTRTGDGGTTGLGNGERVAKDCPRIEAIGAVDAGATFSFSLPLQPSIASGGQHDHERHSC